MYSAQTGRSPDWRLGYCYLERPLQRCNRRRVKLSAYLARLGYGAVLRIVAALDAYVATQGLGVVEISPADIQLTPETIVQPDVFVSPLVGGRVSLDWRGTTSLLLADEILSPSSMRADRVIKRRFYARHDVNEYWVVDLDARIVERTRRGEERPEILDVTLA